MHLVNQLNKKTLWFVAVAVLVLFLLAFVAVGIQIGLTVDKNCQAAEKQYGGECVEALIKNISDNSTQMGKNNAIWTLGQLGDKKALPFLKKLDNGLPTPRQGSWNEGISQYELRKAIKLLENDINIVSFIWR